MAKIDKKYHKLLKTILKDGKWYNDPNRKGVKRLQISHYSFTYNLKDGFPAITTKKLFWKGVVGELLWFLRGDTNIKYLIDNGINIWNKDAYNHFLKSNPTLTRCKGPDDCKELLFEKDNEQHFNLWLGNIVQNKKENLWFGDCGRIYGAQWRNFTVHNVGPNDSFPIYVDQIQKLIQNLKEKPLATDHIVTAWNPAELDNMALPPCHKGFQLMVYELTTEERLGSNSLDNLLEEYSEEEINDNLDHENAPKYGFDLVWEQRSVDTFLGLPFNIASYALLASIIGKIVNMVPGKIIGDLRNIHIYDNAIDGVKKQLSRNVDKYDKCELKHSKTKAFYKSLSENLSLLGHLDIENFQLENYESYDNIKTEMLSRNE